jgi:hypothetical protein
VEAPNLLPSSVNPTGEIFPNFTSDWTIQLDRQVINDCEVDIASTIIIFLFHQFSRTPRSRFIRIYEENGRLVQRINAASSSNVIYPRTPFDQTLRFRPQFILREKILCPA